MVSQTAGQELLAAWKAQAKAKPLVTVALIVTVGVVLGLVGFSIELAVQRFESGNLRLALLGGSAGFVTTTLGALLVLVLGNISHRSQDMMLGFAAGMMLAASAFSLILPGIEAASETLANAKLGALVVVFGLFLGVLLMLGLDYFTPHEHDSTGPCGPECTRLSKVWLFVFTIALHNLPEGMAVGVAFAQGDWGVGLPLTLAIAIQDIPEGLAVALALRAVGVSAPKAILIAALSGLMEPIGALVGVGMASGFALAYPISLGLAAGAMVFVVSHEVIPETHRHGHQTPATLGLMIGFALMMFLDTALG